MTGQSTAAWPWEKLGPREIERREMHPIEKIVVKGAIDVVFRRNATPTLVVAGEKSKQIASVTTEFRDGKLVIERKGSSISVGRFSIGSIVINGVNIGGWDNAPKVVVGIALPQAPAIKVKGSGDVTLHDLLQDNLELQVVGSGDISASGQVRNFSATVAGSGDVDAKHLVAEFADLSIAGSGDIDAFVRSRVKARVVGSGDIVVFGRPKERDHSVAGSGDIEFP